MEKRIFKSIKENDIQDIKKYIQQNKSLDIIDNDGNTPIMIALINDKPDIAELLYKAGSILNIKNVKGETVYDLANKCKGAETLTKNIYEDLIIINNFGNKPLGYTKYKIKYKTPVSFERQNEAFKIQVLKREMIDTSEIRYYIEYYGKPLTLYIYNVYDDNFTYCGGGMVFDYFRKISLKEQNKFRTVISEYEKRFITTEPPYFMVFDTF